MINPLDKVKLIDLDDYTNNDFAVVDELPFCITKGPEEGSFRPDITILVNGIPLGFLEVKKPNNDGGIQKEFDRMINQRLVKKEFRKFFNMLQKCIDMNIDNRISQVLFDSLAWPKVGPTINRGILHSSLTNYKPRILVGDLGQLKSRTLVGIVLARLHSNLSHEISLLANVPLQ